MLPYGDSSAAGGEPASCSTKTGVAAPTWRNKNGGSAGLWAKYAQATTPAANTSPTLTRSYPTLLYRTGILPRCWYAWATKSNSR